MPGEVTDRHLADTECGPWLRGWKGKRWGLHAPAPFFERIDSRHSPHPHMNRTLLSTPRRHQDKPAQVRERHARVRGEVRAGARRYSEPRISGEGNLTRWATPDPSNRGQQHYPCHSFAQNLRGVPSHRVRSTVKRMINTYQESLCIYTQLLYGPTISETFEGHARGN